MRTNLIDNRQIRVFISSTFQDMQDEREYLMRHTFPVLKQLAARRDVALNELDLRWGITEEEAETGKVVEICLREIENSIPFFVGIIGNRYGWVPEKKDIGLNVTERFPDVKDYIEKHLSVTDMEMQFGVLNRKEDMHAYFYIKEQEEAQDNPEMLNRLKDAVRASRYPDSTYASPEDLGEQVKEAFIKLLDDIFPEKELSEVEKEAGTQRAFRNSLCRNYIRDEHNFDAIDKWLEYSDSSQFVITGASGIGKSAFIANWIKEKEQTKTFPYHIVYHFVGNGGNEGSHGHIAHSLVGAIQAAYGFEKDKYRNDNDELDNLFQKVASEGDQPLLVVLDAVNQIADEENAKQLNWLPIPPKNVRILFSTLEDDKTMDVFRNRKYPIFTLQPLNLDRRRQLVETYLSSYGKKLKDEQITRIITDTQCENTLVLKTLLDELVNFGIFERLDERINYFLRPNTVEQFYQTLLESYEMEFPFTEHVLSLIALSRSGLSEDELLRITKLSPLHWSQFYCSFCRHLTVRAGLIIFGHSYIRNAVETRYALNEEGVKNKTLREEIISLFEGQVTPRALYELPHQYYIMHDDLQLHAVLMDIEVFMHLEKVDTEALINYWFRLQKHYSLEEYMPLALSAKNNFEALKKLSGFCRLYVEVPELSLKFAEKSLDYIEEEKDIAIILNFLGLCEVKLEYYDKAIEHLIKALEINKRIFGANHHCTTWPLNNLGYVYNCLGDYEKALAYQQKALEINRFFYGDKDCDTAMFANNVGENYIELGKKKEALEYVQMSLNIRQELFGDKHPDTAMSLHNMGSIYGKFGNHEKSLEYQLKALKIYQELFGNMHTSTAGSLRNVGLLYIDLGDYNKALEYSLQALEIYQEIYGYMHSQTALALSSVGCSYGELCDHTKELEYQLKALEIRQKILGDEHPHTAYSYCKVGVKYSKLGDHKKALEYGLKALEMYQIIYGNRNSDTATSFNNVGAAYWGLEEYEKSLEYHLKALEIQQEIFGDEHSDTALSNNQVGCLYVALGCPQKALGYFLKALAITQKIYVELPSDTVMLFCNIGSAYGELGDYQNDLIYQLKALELQRKRSGEEHPDTALFYSKVGSCYNTLGDYKNGLEHHLKALEIRQKVFGDNSPDTAASYYNIGCNYTHLDEHQNALKCFRKSLEIRQKVLGNQHLDTAWSFYTLGDTYEYIGEHKKALEHYLRALYIQNEILGEKHSDIAMTLNKVGVAYYSLGEKQKSLEYFLRALKIRQTINGDIHSETAICFGNVGCIYSDLGNHRKALQYDQRTLEIRQNIFGDLHCDTMESFNNVGADYRELGDYKKALQYIGKAKDIAKEIKDENKVAFYTNRLALTYKTAGDMANAIEHYRQAAELYVQLGDKDESMKNNKFAKELQVNTPSSSPYVPKFLKEIIDKFT